MCRIYLLCAREGRKDGKSDVWYSANGEEWYKVMNFTGGDFLHRIGNFDAREDSDVAPWYSRYGHSLDSVTDTDTVTAVQNDDDDDDNDDDDDDDPDHHQVMILMGGYDPVPSNDVWISPNGSTWYFCGYAPWPARAYHATAVLEGGKKLYVMGGTPLSNDVWSGTVVKNKE